MLRSKMRQATLFALLFCLPIGGYATILVIPGDVDAIDIPIENHEGSLLPLKGVRIEVVGPEYFIIKANSITGPVDILPGETKTLTINYEVATTAPPGEFTVELKVRMDSADVEPNPAINASTLIFFIEERASHQATADINNLDSTASLNGNTWDIQLAIDAYSLVGLQRIEVVDSDLTVLASQNVASNASEVSRIILPLTRPIDESAAPLQLRAYDIAGSTSPLDFRFSFNGGGDASVISDASPTGGILTGEIQDTRAPGLSTLGSQVKDMSTGVGIYRNGDALVEGPKFTAQDLYSVATIEYQVGTGDSPGQLSFQTIVTEEVSVNSLLGKVVSRTVGAPITLRRYAQGRVSISNHHADPVPFDTYCTVQGVICSENEVRYRYIPAGQLYVGQVSAISMQDSAMVASGVNTPLGSTITVQQGVAQVVFSQVMGISANPDNPVDTNGGGTTRFEPIIREDAASDLLPRDTAFRLRTTAVVAGNTEISLDYGSFVNQTHTPTRLAGLQLVRLSGAAISTFSADHEAKRLKAIISAASTGEVGVYALALPPDTVEPAAIADLQALVQLPSIVNLFFTSVGDDAMEGRPQAYEVRVLLAGQPYRQFERLADEDSGTPLQIVVPDLPPGSYSFSIRARDRAGNVSDSNVVTAVIPYIFAAGPPIGGFTEAELVAQQPADFEHLNEGDPRGQPFQAAAQQQGLLPLSSRYEVKTAGAVFNPPATLSIRYSNPGPLSPDSLAVYESRPDGSIFTPQQTHDKNNRIVRVTLPTVTSVFQLVGRVLDVISPYTLVAFDGFSSATAEGYRISTITLVGFSAVDPPPSTGTASGVAQTFYLLDSVFVDTQTTPGTAYSSPFAVALGTHTLGYYSVDNAGNYENLQQAFISVEEVQDAPDQTPPITQLSFIGPFTQSNDVIDISTYTALLLTAQDPPSPNGYVTSGVSVTFYSVDGAEPAVFTTTFTLSAGSHSFSYMSEDVAGNAEALQTVQINVAGGNEPPPSNSGGSMMALSRDGPGNLWGILNANGNFSLAKFDAQPALLASVALPGATDGADWSVSFDQAGNAYAVGSSSRPNEATDLALYKVSPEGLLLSTAGYSTGADFNDFALDSSSDVWISGAVMDNLTGVIKLALWRYCPHTGEITKKAEYARGNGVDVSFGLSVFEGTIWAAGYSQNASGTMDLALWRFGSNGSLIGSPTFVANQADEFHQHLKTAVSAGPDGVFVAAARRLAGDSDLSLLKFSTSGQLLSHRLWHGPAGRPERPAALVRRGAVLAAAGQVDEAGAVWTYALDGTFLAAETSSGLGSLSDAAAIGADLWLGAHASSVPLRFQNPTPLSGTDVDLAPAPPGLTAALSPSTGPIGVPFVLTGSGFGPYAGANTRVLFAGTTAPLSLWNDTTIKGTVPFLPQGAHTVSVTRQHPSSATVWAAGLFTLQAPVLASFTPSTGPIGVPFTLSGSGFGPYAGANSVVLFAGTTAALSLWNDTTIKGTVPALPVGTHPVLWRRSTTGGSMDVPLPDFEVRLPSDVAVSPSSAPIGAPFTLTGSGFGPYAGANSKIKIGGVSTPLSLWNDTTIKGTVPNVPAGAQSVVFERQSGAGLMTADFGVLVITTPTVYAVTPDSGPIGVPFTLTGRSFGPYAGALTRVLIGGATCALSLWNDTTIKGTVPPALPPGEKQVIVERATSDGGLVQSAPLTFNLLELGVASLSPSSGPIGVPFTVTGTQFGPYAGANTRVKIGGVLAPLSLWNDTTIKGTIPYLPAGSHELVIERQSGSTVAAVSGGLFEVTVPALSEVFPSSAPVGAPFTLTGSSFGPYAGTLTRVLIGGATCALSLWNDTTIKGSVPVLAPGLHSLIVERAVSGGSVATPAVSFLVVEPTVAVLSPSSGPIGAPFTLTGSGFGPYGGSNTTVKIGGVTAPLSLWNDTTIKGTVPNAPVGAQAVVVARYGVETPAPAFTVLAPELAALAPSSAPIGAPFVLTGSGFGPYAGSNTRVKIGGINAPLSLWNDTTIRGTVPGALTAGTQDLVVERATSDGGLSATAPLPFLVLVPAISSITPGSGPTGTAFTLSGAGFGPYAGSATKVKVGGAAASLSLWNDTTIKGIIPDSLSVGTHSVIVERSPAGGVVESNAVEFSVETEMGSLSFSASSPQPDAFYAAALAVPSEEGGTVEAPSRAAVTVPAAALPETVEITLSRGERHGRDKDAREEAQAKSALAPVGAPVEFGPEGTRFTVPVIIELPYDPLTLAPGAERLLAIHYWNRETKTWEKLQTELDPIRKRLRARTDHFSLYQPLGPGSALAAAPGSYGLREVYAYPNPARGGTASFHIDAGDADSIHLRIYDVAGGLVHEASPVPGQDYAWSTAGVGSGVYYYVVTAKKAGQGDLRKRGKLAVLK